MNLKTFYLTKMNRFNDCGKSDCGCHSPKEDELEKTLKAKNYQIIQCINNGKFDDALNLSEEFISIVKSNYGDEHPFYCSAVNNKAFILKSCGEFDEARPLFEEVIQKYKSLYGDNNEKVVISMHNLATLLKEAKDFEGSLAIYEKLINMIEKENVQIEGEKTGKLRLNIVANIYNSAGGLYRQLKDYKESERLFQLAFNIVKTNYGEKTLPIASILNNMALCDKDQGKIENAREKYKKALDILTELLPADHPELKMTKENLDVLENTKEMNLV